MRITLRPGQVVIIVGTDENGKVPEDALLPEDAAGLGADAPGAGRRRSPDSPSKSPDSPSKSPDSPSKSPDRGGR